MIGCLDVWKAEHQPFLRPSHLHPPIHSSTHPVLHPSSLPSIHPPIQSSIHPPIQSSHLPIDRLLALQAKVERNPQAITRLKTIGSLVAAGIAFLAAMLNDWLFGSK